MTQPRIKHTVVNGKPLTNYIEADQSYSIGVRTNNTLNLHDALDLVGGNDYVSIVPDTGSSTFGSVGGGLAQQTLIQSAGTGTNAVKIDSTLGSIEINAKKDINLLTNNVSALKICEGTNRVGLGTNTPVTTLEVVGTITGTTKNFDISHPEPGKETKRLRHGTISGNNVGDCMYFYNITTTGLQYTIALPSYFPHLCNTSNVCIFAHPRDTFGRTKASYNNGNNTVTIYVDTEGTYDVCIRGTRNDTQATTLWDVYGSSEEYEI